MKVFKKILKVILIIIISYIIIGMIGGPIAFAAVLGKKETKKDTDYVSIWKYNRDDYPLLENRKVVHFDSCGNALTAYLYEVDNPYGIVICAHGLGNYSDCDNAEYQNYFVEKGFDVLAVDLTGSGNSEGKCTRNLYQSKYDIIAAIDFVKEYDSTKNLKINLAGHSAGAYGAIMASSEREVNAVFAMSSYDSPNEVAVEIIRDNIGILTPIVRPFIEFSLLMFGGKENYQKASDVINNNKDTKYYLVHSSIDDYINYNTASLLRHYYEPNFDYGLYDVYNIDFDVRSLYYENKALFAPQKKENVYASLITWGKHCDTWLSFDSQHYSINHFWVTMTNEYEESGSKGTLRDYVEANGRGRIDRERASEINEDLFANVIEMFLN